MTTKQGSTVRRTAAVRGRKGLQGIDWVQTDKLTQTGFGSRKPTTEELEQRWALIERNYDQSSEIRRNAGLPPLVPNFYAEALYAALELREAEVPSNAPRKRAKATRKPAKVETPKPAKPSTNGNGRAPVHGERKPSTRQVYFLAARALESLGLDFPSDRAGADRLIKQLLAA